MNQIANRLRLQVAIVFLLLTASLPALAQNPTIGLYTDETGNTCSFTGDAPGLVTGYVVFRPRPEGATAVQFAGPVPPCFGGVFIDATTQFLKIGTFTGGISIAFGSCVTGGLNVLTVNFFRAGGATASCCAYPLVNDPLEQNIVAANCSNFDLYTVGGITSYFNANVQCECFTSDVPPTIPSNPSPADQAVNAPLVPTMTWVVADVDGDLEEYDLYFGTSPNPPLLAPGLTTDSYTPAPLAPLTQHYWRIVARDSQNHETSGPVWTFTTRAANTPPSAPANPAPSDGVIGVGKNPTLTWAATDADGDPLHYDVYFGASSPPPLVASGVAVASYAPGPLPLMTPHYWRVIASDGDDETSSPTWSFTTAMLGDVIADGQITVADANCALQMTLEGLGCGGEYAFERGDVNCDSYVTPRDARCIHKKAVDGSCTFCGPPFAPVQQALPAVLEVSPAFTAANGDVGVLVYVSGVPLLEAFIFRLKFDPNVEFVNAIRFGATGGFAGWGWAPFLPFPQLFNASVAGYTLGSVPANDVVGLVELRFRLTSGATGNAQIIGGYDDLAGANEVSFEVEYGPPLPVFISRFEAVPAGNSVEVSWQFSSDEPVDTYQIYRGAGSASSIVIAQGNAATTRSFVDRDVQPATQYRYELVVRTQDGEEYRSQPVTITTAALALALGQNHPNPFNPSTTIPFTVASDDSRVRLFVLDAGGRVVRTLFNGTKPAGSHTVAWDGRDERGTAASSGVYFYVLDVGGERRTRKMVLLK